MSIKTLFQFTILCFILIIIGGVYIKYFNNEDSIIQENNASENNNLELIKELEKKLLNLEIKNQELNDEILKNNNKNILTKEKTEVEDKDKDKVIDKDKEKEKINQKIAINENTSKQEKEKADTKVIKNLVKDVEYISVDEKGNRFHLLANSGRSNPNDKNILDLDNVRGKITSDKRDTIYIVSDYAQYDTVNLNSKFYKNVIINYQDKKINCLNFDINMDTNKAIAYNNVIIVDPNSTMRAGIVEFDLKTKDIVINPENANSDIRVISN